MANKFNRSYESYQTKDFSNFTENQRKFINMLMHDGKKSVARRVFEKARNLIMNHNLEKDFNEFFEKAIHNASPVMEVRSKRIAGSSYQVPFEVKETRRRALASRWLIGFARKKSGKSMEERLANELISAYKNEGEAVKRKEEMHRMAEANRAFAHFAKY